MVARNISRFGHDRSKMVGALVDFDTKFNGLDRAELQYGPGRVFREVILLGPEEGDRARENWVRVGVSAESARTLLPFYGYGSKRNRMIAEAIRGNYDRILFWDDDEYPIACMRKDTGIW